MKREAMIRATREGVGIFDMANRGLLEVRGEDRVRWLDGMISGDVQALEDAGKSGESDQSEKANGCYAMLLTNRGKIIADLHVGRFGDHYLLESLRSEIPRIHEAFDRFIVADDVELADRSDDWLTTGIEGPQARSLLEKVAGSEFATLEAECWLETAIAGRPVLAAAFGFTGETGFQLRMVPDDRVAVEDALFAAANADGLVRGDFEALEIMRVEAGIALSGAELTDDVLPPEARLERTISTSKGCYIGQEIVARLRARGQVNHLLVGLRLESSDLPSIGTSLSVAGRTTGEFTTVVRSPQEGPIALAYVRREHSEIGTEIDFENGIARVVALPFFAPSAGEDSAGQTSKTVDSP